MKKLFSIFILAALSLLVIPAPISQAAEVVTITEPTHRQLDGAFIDDELSNLISYNGRLGSLVFAPSRGNKIWQIDPALIDEISSMTKPYLLADGKAGAGSTAAQIWLSRLKSVTRNGAIIALPYGNPSGYWIHRLLPHDESYFLNIGAEKLQSYFGRPVSVSITYPDMSQFRLNSLAYQSLVEANKTISATASFMSGDELELYRLRSTSVLNSKLSAPRRDYLARDLTSHAYDLSRRIRLSASKFTVTSEKQNLPITVINDYQGEAKLKIYISALNSKVLTESDMQELTIAGKSKVQIKVPVTVLASGQSALLVTIKNKQGVILGEPTRFPLTLSVISPVATWLTTIAAILLFAGAIFQSARRIKRSRT